MKHNPSELMRKLQFPLTIAAVSMPLSLLLFSIFWPGWMPFVWLLPGVYVVVAAGSLLVPGKWRLAYGLAAIAVILAVGIWMSLWIGVWWMLLMALVYGLILFAGLRMAGWEWYQEPPPILFYSGCGLFAAVQVVMILLNSNYPSIPWRMENGMTVSFLVFALCLLLSLNRNTLNGAAAHKHRVSANVRSKNRTMVLIFFAIIAILVGVPAIVNAALEGIRWIVRWLSELFEKPYAPPEVTVPGTIETTPKDPGLLNDHVSLFAKIMKVIFRGVCLLAMVVGVPVALIFVWKNILKLVNWVNKTAESAGRAWREASDDYEEEITDIRDEAQFTRQKEKRARFAGFLQERKLAPGERIRNRYGKLQSKHKDWSASSTARENIPVEAASVYERARYSDEPITEADAQKFAKDIRKI